MRIADFILDLAGLKCPLPALKAAKFLKSTPTGSHIDVICTDPMAAIDIPALLNQTGDQLLSNIRVEGKITFRIVKVG